MKTKRLEANPKSQLFHGLYQFTVLRFLPRFPVACDSTENYEAVVMYPFYFSIKQAARAAVTAELVKQAQVNAAKK